MQEEGIAPDFSFTLARGQNQFFVELAEALAYELRALGVTASITIGEPEPPRERLVHVFLPPHEYESLSRYRPPAGLLRRSIVISAEQPQSHHFLANIPLAREAGAAFDINPRAVRAYVAEGVNASLLRLGHTSLWDRYEGVSPRAKGDAAQVRLEPSGRDIDVLFLGRLTNRRQLALASYADTLERFRCHFLLSDNSRPNTAGTPGFVAGAEKRELLSRAKVLINLHGEEEPYFEWLRVVEAICAGCAIVSEHSTDISPLEWGTHLMTGRLGSLGLLCAWLVEDDERRELMRRSAYELLVRERPLADAAHQLLAAANAIMPPPPSRHLELTIRQVRARKAAEAVVDPFPFQPFEQPDLSNGERLLLRSAKQQTLMLSGLRRQLAQIAWTFTTGSPDGPKARPIVASPAWAQDLPRTLTVVVPLFNHRNEVLAALNSLERSSRRDWEAVIVDDASTDGGGDAVRAWIDSRPQLACHLVRHDLNRGLPAARNTGIDIARTERVLMLDADNEVRRRGIARLMDALDADPGASFAYGIMERFSVDGPEGLVSCYGWDPERLRSTNYIDAFALIRRESILALNGYSYDQRLYGWEDYDLWVRMAEAGQYGAFVPEIVARYRVGQSSMISQTNVSTADAYAALVEHAPRLLARLNIPG